MERKATVRLLGAIAGDPRTSVALLGSRPGRGASPGFARGPRHE